MMDRSDLEFERFSFVGFSFFKYGTAFFGLNHFGPVCFECTKKNTKSVFKINYK